MNWNNLKQRKCPICGNKLLRSHLYMRCSKRDGGVYKISNTSECKFTISKMKYRELGGLLKSEELNEWEFKTISEVEDEQYRKRVLEEVKKINRKAKKIRYLNRKLKAETNQR